jgi:hypothetical protein
MLDPGQCKRCIANAGFERALFVGRKAACVEHQRGNASLELARSDARRVGKLGQRRQRDHPGSSPRLNGLFDDRHCFSPRATPIKGSMSIFDGMGARSRALFADIKGPWGSGTGSGGKGFGGKGTGGKGGGGDGPDEPSVPKGPWGEPPKRGARPPSTGPATVSSLDDFLRKNRNRFGGSGGGGGSSGRPTLPSADPKIIVWAIAGLAPAVAVVHTVHRIAPEERGVVTRFGRYSHTLSQASASACRAPNRPRGEDRRGEYPGTHARLRDRRNG